MPLTRRPLPSRPLPCRTFGGRGGKLPRGGRQSIGGWHPFRYRGKRGRTGGAFPCGSGRRWTQRVYPDGAGSVTTTLSRIVFNEASGIVYFAAAIATLNSTGFSLSANRQWFTDGTNGQMQAGGIVVHEVYGWR